MDPLPKCNTEEDYTPELRFVDAYVKYAQRRGQSYVYIPKKAYADFSTVPFIYFEDDIKKAGCNVEYNVCCTRWCFDEYCEHERDTVLISWNEDDSSDDDEDNDDSNNNDDNDDSNNNDNDDGDDKDIPTDKKV
jgi:hypothetical protein